MALLDPDGTEFEEELHEGEDDAEVEEEENEISASPAIPSRLLAQVGSKVISLHGYADEDEEEATAARDQGLLQSVCLPISGKPLQPSGKIPETADEYLRQVQWERLHCAGLVDVEVEERPSRRQKRRPQGALFGHFQPADEISEDLRPSATWVEDTSRAFRSLRICCGEAREAAAAAPRPAEIVTRFSLSDWKQRCDSSRPSTELLAVQDFVSIKRLVTASVEGILSLHEALGTSAKSETENPKEEEPNDAAVDIGKLDIATEWMFAAMAFLEEPLIDDIQYELQRLRRSCQSTIASTQRRAAAEDPGDANAASRLYQERASLLLVIVTDVFGQR